MLPVLLVVQDIKLYCCAEGSFMLLSKVMSRAHG